MVGGRPDKNDSMEAILGYLELIREQWVSELMEMTSVHSVGWDRAGRRSTIPGEMLSEELPDYSSRGLQANASYFEGRGGSASCPWKDQRI
jgi:hypothetical protein